MRAEDRLSYAQSKEGMAKARAFLSSRNEAETAAALALSESKALRARRETLPALAESGENAAALASLTAELERAETLLIERYQTLLKRRDAVAALIDQVSPPAARHVLRLRYLEGLPFFKIAQRLHYEERWIYRLHRQGLQRTALLLLQAEESAEGPGENGDPESGHLAPPPSPPVQGLQTLQGT